jgi:hypothetical protein
MDRIPYREASFINPHRQLTIATDAYAVLAGWTEAGIVHSIAHFSLDHFKCSLVGIEIPQYLYYIQMEQ